MSHWNIFFDYFSNEKIQIQDYPDFLIFNVFLYDIHIGPLWTKLVENIHKLSYKEITRIVAITINVEDMASHHWSGVKNRLQKRKIEEEPINFLAKKFKSGVRKEDPSRESGAS